MHDDFKISQLEFLRLFAAIVYFENLVLELQLLTLTLTLKKEKFNISTNYFPVDSAIAMRDFNGSDL